MILFSVPDSGPLRPLTEETLKLQKEKPEWFFDDFQIDIAYGAPATCIWNGNREIGEQFLRPAKWKAEVVGKYAAYGVKYRLNFTNFLLKKEHLYDAYANKIAEMLDEVGGYVMVSTPMMAEYMWDNYPNLQVGWSTTTDFGTDVPSQIKKINELSETGLVVPPYTLNNKYDLLDQLVHPENIEFLADEKCVDDCPYRRQHETNSNRYILYESEKLGCVRNEMVKDKTILKKHHIVEREYMTGYYKDRGFHRFKLEGRANPPTWLFHSYREYFVRPEYRVVFTECMINRVELDEDEL